VIDPEAVVPTLSALTLTEFTIRIFEAAGLPTIEARAVVAGLVGANLRGHDSHGVLRTAQYIDFLEKGDYQIGVELIVERDGPVVVVCDAQWGFGQVQAHRLLDLILPRAQTLGMAAGTARHCGHIGRLGEYAERAVELGLILIATVNNAGAGQRVAPPGGIEPRLGTNPLCVGVPAESGPIILDFGTSVVAEGKVRAYYHNNKAPVPEGWLLDHEGKPTTDPSVLYEQPLGSILPMGGSQAYKGFGLSLVLDMLSGGLTGGRSSHPGAGAAKGNNVVFLLLDPNAFVGQDALIQEATQLAAFVRGSRRADGVESILLPGDPERAVLADRSRNGIPLPEAHWIRLVELGRRLGVEPPELKTT
jgi:hydroxycarboxylate dehydrogenase B